MMKKWTGERLETFVFNDNTVEHLHRYALACELAVGKVVLDIACGEGYGTSLIAKVAASVTGVDIVGEVVENATKKYVSINLNYKVGSCDQIPCNSSSFDLVVSFETIEHHDQHEAMLDEIKRVLKPGGILLISSPDKKYYSDERGYRNPFHIKELYAEEFKALLTSKFVYCNFMGQKMIAGSLIQSEFDDTSFSTWFTGNYDAVTTTTASKAIYNLALASDQPIAMLKNSFFVSGSLSAVFDYRNSKSYRLGYTLLYPFIKLRNILLKKLP